MEPATVLSHSQELTNSSYPEPDQSNPWTLSVVILSSHLRLGLSLGFFPSVLPTKTFYAPLQSPYVLHAPPISFFLIWSPELCLVKNRDNKAPQYVVFSTPLSPRLT